MKILGLDPGTDRFGYALIEWVQKTQQKKLVHESGILKKPYKNIYTSLDKIVAKHLPDAIAIEKLFFVKNTKTAISVAETRGIAILLAQTRGIRLVEFNPTEIKLAITGYGLSDKIALRRSLAFHLPKEELNKIVQIDDAADAAAIAITGFYSLGPLHNNFRNEILEF